MLKNEIMLIKHKINLNTENDEEYTITVYGNTDTGVVTIIQETIIIPLN